MGVAFCLISFGAIASAPLRGQTWRGKDLEDKWKKAAWHVGPFHLQPSIVISNVGVDSNIYYSPNEPIKDFTLTAGPAALLYLPLWRKVVISGYGSPQYVYYSKTKAERSWNYYYSGAVAFDLRNVFLRVEKAYSDAKEHWNTEIDIRPRRKEDDWAGTFLIKTSRRTSVELGFRQAKYDYQSALFQDFDVRRALNRKEDYYNLSAYYQATSRTRYFLDGEYGTIRFDFAEAAAIRNSDSKAGYAGLEFSPTGRIRGRIRVGYKALDVLNAPEQNYRGIVGDSQVSLQLARPFLVRAGYRRNVQFSLWYNNAYYIESVPTAGASFYLLNQVRFDYDYSNGRNRYPAAQEVVPGETAKRFDDYQIHSAGVYFRIWKKTALGFIMSWWARTSNIASENDKRMFYGANLTYDF